MKEEPPSEFDAYAGSYAAHVDRALPPGIGEVDKFARIKVRHLVKEIERRGLTSPDLRILDMGCGVGIADSFLKTSFPNIVGLDVSEESLQEARRRNPELQYLHYDGESVPTVDSAFDVVFAMCVVHHVPSKNWPSFFENCRNLLRPGGLLAIYEHNPWNPVTLWVVSRCEFDRDAELISMPSCRKLAVAAGFIRPAPRFILFAPFETEAWMSLESSTCSALPIGAQYQFTAIKP